MTIYAPCPPDLGTGAQDAPRHVVEVWLAVPAGSTYQALLLRRAPDAGGFWQSVSGGVEPGDATYLEAAFRELREETGLGRAGTRVVDLESTAVFRGPVSGLWYRKWCVGMVLPADTGPESVRLSAEHDRVRLVSFEQARALMSFEGQATELRRFEALLARDERPNS